MIRALALAALLASAAAVSAQSRGVDCSKARDPKACEARVAKVKAARDKARKACEGKKGEEARECLQRERCAQTKDPAKCEQIVAACKDKKGAERRNCLREQRSKK